MRPCWQYSRWRPPCLKLRGRLVELRLQLPDVLEQTRACKTQEIETEGRILHIELLDLAVADAENQAVSDAFHRLRATLRRRQHAEFANDGADRQLDARFHEAKATADDVGHVLGLLVLVVDDLAGLAWALRHERLQPVHREVA